MAFYSVEIVSSYCSAADLLFVLPVSQSGMAKNSFSNVG